MKNHNNRARYSEPQQLQAQPSARSGLGRLLAGGLLRLREPRSGVASKSFAALLTILACQPAGLFAQGSLMPPGSPAPTMKSLDQIEARTPISAAPCIITNPGSYYLTANLNVTTGDAITIGANGVTLDLNGFTLSSSDPNNTGKGVLLDGSGGRRQNVTILNGFITGSVGYDGSYSGYGFESGITYTGPVPYAVRVAGVSVSGCLFYGIYLNTGFSTVVESCTVQTVGNYGIVAAGVYRCAAYQCGSTAIFGTTVSDCYGYCLGGGDAVIADTANNCYGFCDGGGIGLFANNASNCHGQSSRGRGLRAGTANSCDGYCALYGPGLIATTALNCRGESGGDGDGMMVTVATGCYGNSTNAGIGLLATIALNSAGKSINTDGLIASAAANNCWGYSAQGNGVNAVSAANCSGQSDGEGYGVLSDTAIGCEGYSRSFVGLSGGLAIGCRGESDASAGVGLDVYIANSCFGDPTAGSQFHYNMPP